MLILLKPTMPLCLPQLCSSAHLAASIVLTDSFWTCPATHLHTPNALLLLHVAFARKLHEGKGDRQALHGRLHRGTYLWLQPMLSVECQ
jgi:hypothetical protein